MINIEYHDSLFVVRREDRELTKIENFIAWYQSMNRLVGNESSTPNILGALYFCADYYLRYRYPAHLVESVLRRAEPVFFSILRRSKSAKVYDLQTPVIFYIRLGLFDDAFRVADLIVQTVDECFEFDSRGQRMRTLASLKTFLNEPIKSRLSKVEKSRALWQKFLAPPAQEERLDDGLRQAWDQYVELQLAEIPDIY